MRASAIVRRGPSVCQPVILPLFFQSSAFLWFHSPDASSALEVKCRDFLLRSWVVPHLAIGSAISFCWHTLTTKVKLVCHRDGEGQPAE